MFDCGVFVIINEKRERDEQQKQDGQKKFFSLGYKKKAKVLLDVE